MPPRGIFRVGMLLRFQFIMSTQARRESVTINNAYNHSALVSRHAQTLSSIRDGIINFTGNEEAPRHVCEHAVVPRIIRVNNF